ncbi:MAG: serine O-acetyltransferase EpsC [Planctomycetaceae bacterium]
MNARLLRLPSEQTIHDLKLEGIVSELEQLRNESLQVRRQKGIHVRLPSRKILTTVIEGLSAALYPNRLSGREFASDSINYFVGHTLETSLRQLAEQIVHELNFETETSLAEEDAYRRAMQIVGEFARTLPMIRSLLDSDMEAAFRGDPAARSVDEILACYPGIFAMIHHRIAHELYRLGLPMISRMIAEIAHSLTGIDIHPGAKIGRSFFIDHGTGVVIGETAVIGDRVRLYQAVTLGAKNFPTDEQGNLLKGHPRHPLVEDDVVIYAGATILGRITIGKGSVIGGNVWLTRSVPPSSQISQAKVRSEDYTEGSGI